MKSKVMKKLRATVAFSLSCLMIASLVSLSTIVSYAVPVDAVFTDVSQSDWFYGDVQYAYDNEIMNGIANDKFDPNSPLSRAMGVTILYRAAGKTRYALLHGN